MIHCIGPCHRPMTARTNRAPGTVAHCGRGLCRTCYDAAHRAGTLIDHPRVVWRPDEMLDEWDRLRRAGVLRAEAAERMGVRLETLERMLQRHRNDPRAKLGQRRELYLKQRDEVTGRYVS